MKTVTDTYTIAYLSAHPLTKNIVHKYLVPISGGAVYLEHLHCTLEGLAVNNMGGGIPYETMLSLCNELNTPDILFSLSQSNNTKI